MRLLSTVIAVLLIVSVYSKPAPNADSNSEEPDDQRRMDRQHRDASNSLEDDSDEDAFELDSGVLACSEDGPCVCSGHTLDCDDELVDTEKSSEDEVRLWMLDSANLQVPSNITVRHAQFRGNYIRRLRKGYVLEQAKRTVRDLTFAHNTMNEIENGVFEGFRNLTKLDLSHNRLRRIQRETFKGLDRLEVLNLSHNFISKIPRDAFDELKNLKTLNVDRNRLRRQDKRLLRKLSSSKKVTVVV